MPLARLALWPELVVSAAAAYAWASTALQWASGKGSSGAPSIQTGMYEFCVCVWASRMYALVLLTSSLPAPPSSLSTTYEQHKKKGAATPDGSNYILFVASPGAIINGHVLVIKGC